MKDILFLAQRIQMGFGVSVVVDALARELVKKGHRVGVACWSSAVQDPPYQVFLVDSSTKQCREAALKMNRPVVIAHTSPFFEILPELSHEFECWAYEHGDPAPHLFNDLPGDMEIRAGLATNKQLKVYPVIKGVISISQFIRHDIGVPNSRIVYNGCDHTPDLGTKCMDEFRLGSDRKTRVGTLMRLGAREARYKGNQTFVEIAKTLMPEGNFEFWAMGKGTEEDAALFESQGVKAKLNGTEEEKQNYLRGLDVFVSCSLWEGCNLPLIEAQALGTPGIAFDVGAHPEVTPLIATNISEIVSMIRAFHRNPALLQNTSRESYHFVRNRFTWQKAAETLLKIVQ